MEASTKGQLKGLAKKKKLKLKKLKALFSFSDLEICPISNSVRLGGNIKIGKHENDELLD